MCADSVEVLQSLAAEGKGPREALNALFLLGLAPGLLVKPARAVQPGCQTKQKPAGARKPGSGWLGALSLGLLLTPSALAGASSGSRRLIAVLPPQVSCADAEACRSAAQSLQNGLLALLKQDDRYQVVTRTDPQVLEQLEAELRFQNGGLVADEEVQKLGKLAGIEIFVWVNGEVRGGFLGSSLTLRVRFIAVETSKLLAFFEVSTRGKPALGPERSVSDAVAKGLKSLAVLLESQ